MFNLGGPVCTILTKINVGDAKRRAIILGILNRKVHLPSVMKLLL